MRKPGTKAVLSAVIALVVVVSAVSATVVAAPPVSEEAYVQAAPERGDAYFEAEASDGSWISYQNPRDEYRSPYLGDGSGKICVVLLNENGDPVVGESVPNTTVTVPTGDSLAWHSGADPITVELPMTSHYDQPLDADQFGTSDLPQGDGYLDSHCYEFHGLPEDATIEYGEAQVDGEHADQIDVVGYHQQAHAAWDSDVDPIADAESYEEAGGGWTYQTDASHGQAVVVLQLDSTELSGEGDADASGETDDERDDRTVSDGAANETDKTDETDENGDEATDADAEAGAERAADDQPGFGVLLTVLALSLGVLARTRR